MEQTTMKVTDEMVTRFLGWKLPENFSPDGGISFARTVNTYIDGQFVKDAPRPKQDWPVGTNLLDAEQARLMLEHVLDVDEGRPVVPHRSGGGEWVGGKRQ